HSQDCQTGSERSDKTGWEPRPTLLELGSFGGRGSYQWSDDSEADEGGVRVEPLAFGKLWILLLPFLGREITSGTAAVFFFLGCPAPASCDLLVIFRRREQ